MDAARNRDVDVAKETPQLIYDGDCPFCKCWVDRLHQWLSFPGMYVPYNEETHYPLTGLKGSDFKTAVVFWSPHDGVQRGGSAVMYLLAMSGKMDWLVRAYNKWPPVRKVINWGYDFVSEHRSWLIPLTLCRRYRNRKSEVKVG